MIDTKWWRRGGRSEPGWDWSTGYYTFTSVNVNSIKQTSERSFAFLTLIALPALYELTEGLHTRINRSWTTSREGNVGAAVAPGAAAE